MLVGENKCLLLINKIIYLIILHRESDNNSALCQVLSSCCYPIQVSGFFIETETSLWAGLGYYFDYVRVPHINMNIPQERGIWDLI